MIEVVHYVTENGNDAFGEWLSKQDANVIARVERRIDRIRRGNFGDHKGLGSGISELRVDYGPGYRVYYGRDGQDVVILLAGGTKRRQDRDIERARTCWEDYTREKRNADRTP